MTEHKNILDLPIERQKELAKRMNLSHEEWVVKMKQTSAELKEFSAQLDANKGKRPEGWTDADAERFQKKIDSATH